VALNEGVRYGIGKLFPGVLPKAVVIHKPVNISLIEGVYRSYFARFTFVRRIFNGGKRLDRLVKAF